MHWVKDFYEQQYTWLGNLKALRDDQVDQMEHFTENRGTSILELGGGAGNFAVAAAKRGYDVTVIELVSSAIEKMRQLAKEHHVEHLLHVVEGDFHTVELPEKYDLICYWDGFGTGTDEDQLHLLNRVEDWLRPNGQAMIDIYTPWYWAQTAGREMSFNDVMRQYDFDPYHCRMIDTWWSVTEQDQAVSQSLRCYSPADLELLLQETNLRMDQCEPGGAMDYENGFYTDRVPLHQAMMFTAILKR